MNEQKTITASVLGTIAFKAGKKRVPFFDKDLMALLKGNEIGEGLPVLNAWLASWDAANLSA